MKRKVDIEFNAVNIPGGAASILEVAGCAADVANVHDYTIQDVRSIIVHVKLDDGDARLTKLLEVLNKYDVNPDMFSYVEYSDEDRQNAVLLRMINDPNTWVSAGPEHGTKYDLTDACPKCGSGAKQSSALYVSGDHLQRIRQHRAVGTWGGGPLVDGGIEKKLRDSRVTGISFGDVYARLKNTKRTLVARHEIIVTHTLPPAANTSKLDRTDACSSCGRGGIQGSPNICYHRQVLGNIRDFNLTWEWFGPFDYNGDLKKSRFSTPAILVTPKVMNIFREAGVTTFDWIPIFVED